MEGGGLLKPTNKSLTNKSNTLMFIAYMQCLLKCGRRFLVTSHPPLILAYNINDLYLTPYTD